MSIIIVNNKTNEGAFAAPSVTCSLCCEDKAASTICFLSGCSHKSCNECMVTWIEKEEASGQASLPKCPFCRLEMTHEDILAIMGRPFQPASTRTAPNEEELDELTLQWLNEQTRQCHSCGARIEKIDGGCDMMECMCGYRFCYGCGSQGAQCSCTPSHHYFWDNVLDRQAQRESGPVAIADEESGLVSLLDHINARKKQEADEEKRKERMRNRKREEKEQDELDEFTSSARWLFTTEKAGIRMLEQYGCTKEIQRARKDKQASRQREVRDRMRVGEATGIVMEKFLFLENEEIFTKMLTQQVRVEGMAQRRADKRMARQDDEELSDIDLTIVNGSFLFKESDPSKTSVRLANLFHYASDQNNARWKERDDYEDDTKLSGIDLAIMNGSFLFRETNLTNTSARLAKLCQRAKDIRKAQWDRMFDNLFQCNRPDCENCARKKALTEEVNAVEIRLLFLKEEEKEKERVEIERFGL